MGESGEKYITFSGVYFKKDLENNKSIKYKLKFIDSFRLMATSLSNLTNNLSDQLYNNCSDCKNLLNYMVLKYDKIVLDVLNAKRTLLRILTMN